ncbi:MAG: HAMP domain-containing protein [Deltaproteobacteria bacterium]|nr:HAMP domain-containing protein [Deltaproteobacteria bacterium]
MKWREWTSKTSIRTKLILGVAFVHLVLMTVFVVDLAQRQRVFLLQEATNAALKQASLTAAAASSWVLADDLAGIEEVLQTSQENTPLRYALIADPQGLVLAHTDRRLAGKYLDDPSSRQVLQKAQGTQVWHNDQHTIHVAAPILADERNIGWVFLGLDTTPTEEHLALVTTSGLRYTLVAIAVGAVFAWLLARYILRQLNPLLAGVDRLGNDRLDQPIPIINQDEIGKVGRALNTAMQALRQSRDEIEREVAERRRAEQDIRYLSQKLIGSSEEERKRIGHDLHDELGQMITSFQFGLQSMTEILRHDPAQASQLCGQLANQAEEMGDAIHRIASFLWPATLEHMGLLVATQAYLNEVNQRLPGLKINFTPQNLAGRLDPRLELVCFRIIQEALTNITRHSKARSVEVGISRENGWLSLSIRDDGEGFAPEGDEEYLCAKGGGIGIMGMRERAASVGGSLRINSASGQGCRIEAQIPLTSDLETRGRGPA